ncbi:hypothetical protein M1513_00160 [Patescibacteria group bacterium]|nr:hypothetical protein [Patescibacteria group bacterium]MCL5733564.1 hypothetical protein [Patescibacteria group bacterium]
MDEVKKSKSFFPKSPVVKIIIGLVLIALEIFNKDFGFMPFPSNDSGGKLTASAFGQNIVPTFLYGIAIWSIYLGIRQYTAKRNKEVQ